MISNNFKNIRTKEGEFCKNGEITLNTNDVKDYSNREIVPSLNLSNNDTTTTGDQFKKKKITTTRLLSPVFTNTIRNSRLIPSKNYYLSKYKSTKKSGEESLSYDFNNPNKANDNNTTEINIDDDKTINKLHFSAPKKKLIFIHSNNNQSIPKPLLSVNEIYVSPAIGNRIKLKPMVVLSKEEKITKLQSL